MKNLFWTASGARLKLVKSNTLKPFNWLFLPGGPGLGSESLADLMQLLDLPGAMWAFDLPGDGSNISESYHFSNWQKALIEAVCEFENTILVGHSSGGMFALATPEVENHLKGLVLMSSAPDASWQNCFMEHINNTKLPGNDFERALDLQKTYQLNPSNELLKTITLLFAPYISLPVNLEKIKNLLEKLPYNHVSHLWAEKNFDTAYHAQWIPKQIPALIFAGDKDFLTPLKLFQQNKLFQRSNIVIKEIKHAAHFPWIDNPVEVKKLFTQFCETLHD